jgi:hypothetical protein
MRILILAAATALAPFTTLAAGDEPSYTVTVELGNVCGRGCIAIIEEALGKVDGIKEAKNYGDKFHFSLTILENKSILPSTILKVVDKIRTDSKGEEDFPLEGFEINSISGTVEKQGDAVIFVARGSKQKYALKLNGDLQKLMDAGKKQLTLAGMVTEEKEKDGKKPLPLMEVSEAKETAK